MSTKETDEIVKQLQGLAADCSDVRSPRHRFFTKTVALITSLRTRLDTAEKELAAISAALDVEYNGPNDKRSGDLLDDIGAFIDHHKAKEAELTKTKEANAELVKDRERLDWLEKEKPIVNRLSLRDVSDSDYWHLCWGDWAHTRHFGGVETIKFSLRQAIDAAVAKV